MDETKTLKNSNEELKRRQDDGSIDEKTAVLAVEDPREGIGSGGASINALLVLAEHLSAKAKLSVSGSSDTKFLNK